ncbi:MAG TPA: porin family protein [Paludibacteraceae bacterium]|nr:porin family protein [Paludibacteraceae bacterium]
MKRILSLAVLFLGLVFSAHAELEEGTFKFGVRAGGGFATLTGDASGLSSVFNFHVGAVGDYAFSESFYLEPGLYFTKKGTSYDLEGYFSSESIDVDLYYLQLPVLASYRFNFTDKFGLNLQAGPYAAFGLFGSCGEDENGDDVSSFDDGNYKRFDAGLRLATGAQFSAFSVSLGYDLGLMNISDAEEVDAKTALFFVTLGYDF